jgi:hypothetical protein
MLLTISPGRPKMPRPPLNNLNDLNGKAEGRGHVYFIGLKVEGNKRRKDSKES